MHCFENKLNMQRSKEKRDRHGTWRRDEAWLGVKLLVACPVPLGAPAIGWATTSSGSCPAQASASKPENLNPIQFGRAKPSIPVSVPPSLLFLAFRHRHRTAREATHQVRLVSVVLRALLGPNSTSQTMKYAQAFPAPAVDALAAMC